jgi:hypothetical protein
MVRYVGPCMDCGREVDRVLRPKRKYLCIDCATERADRQNRAMADGTDPGISKCYAAGHETARQIKAKRGPYYERWRAGIIRNLEGR